MHEHFLRRAIALAIENVNTAQGGPFGSVVVFNGEIVGEGANYVTRDLDPTAHAEVVAIREACRKLGRFDLSGCTVYASCEPCPMCLSAIYWSRADALYFAATRHDADAAGFSDEMLYEQIPLPIEQRSLKTATLLRNEGQEPFAVWRASSTKIPY